MVVCLCQNPGTIEMHYGLIPLCESDIVNPSVTSKPKLNAGVVLTMMMYNCVSPPPKVGVKGKAIHGQIMGHTDRLT